MPSSSILLARIAEKMNSEKHSEQNYVYGVKNTKYASYIYRKNVTKRVDGASSSKLRTEEDRFDKLVRLER